MKWWHGSEMAIGDDGILVSDTHAQPLTAAPPHAARAAAGGLLRAAGAPRTAEAAGRATPPPTRLAVAHYTHTVQ